MYLLVSEYSEDHIISIDQKEKLRPLVLYSYLLIFIMIRRTEPSRWAIPTPTYFMLLACRAPYNLLFLAIATNILPIWLRKKLHSKDNSTISQYSWITSVRGTRSHFGVPIIGCDKQRYWRTEKLP